MEHLEPAKSILKIVGLTLITHSHLDNDLCCKIGSYDLVHSTNPYHCLGDDFYNCVLGSEIHHHKLGCTSPITPRMTSDRQLNLYQNFK